MRNRGLRHKNAKEVYKYLEEKILLTRIKIQNDFNASVDKIEEPFFLSSI